MWKTTLNDVDNTPFPQSYQHVCAVVCQQVTELSTIIHILAVKHLCNNPEIANQQTVWQLYRGVKHLFYYLDNIYISKIKFTYLFYQILRNVHNA